jgi:hypothetical protein
MHAVNGALCVRGCAQCGSSPCDSCARIRDKLCPNLPNNAKKKNKMKVKKIDGRVQSWEDLMKRMVAKEVHGRHVEARAT